jgi:hypothetical protein
VRGGRGRARERCADAPRESDFRPAERIAGLCALTHAQEGGRLAPSGRRNPLTSVCAGITAARHVGSPRTGRAAYCLGLAPALETTRLDVPSGPTGRAGDSAGHPRAIFKRAIERGNVLVAEATAREFALSLEDALQLVLLYAAYEPAKVERGHCGGSAATSKRARA